MFKNNLEKLKQDLNKNNIDLAIITDDDSIYYFTGYFDFLHMSFGRPTILLVPKNSDTVLPGFKKYFKNQVANIVFFFGI